VVLSVRSFNAWQTLSHSEKFGKYLSLNMSILAPPVLWFCHALPDKAGKGGCKATCNDDEHQGDQDLGVAHPA